MSYDGLERRSAVITEDRVALMIQEAVTAALRSHEQQLMLHMDKQFASLRQSFMDAFPDGDAHLHRIAHEQAIRSATWWDKVKSDATSKAATFGIWSIVLFMAVAAWEYVKHEVRK